MSKSCDIHLSKLSDDNVYDPEMVKTIKDRIRDMAKTPDAEERYKEFEKELTEVLNSEHQTSQLHKYISLIKSKNLISESMKFRDYHRGLLSQINGLYSNIKGSQYSLDALMKGISEFEFSSFLTDLQKENLLDFYFNPDNQLDVAKSIWLPDEAPNEHAKKIGEIYRKYLERYVDMQNKRGASIQSLDHYLWRQSHDPSELVKTADTLAERQAIYNQVKKEVGWRNIPEIRKRLAQIAYERWKNFILPLLDISRSFNLTSDIPKNLRDEKLNEILRDVYNTLLKGRSPNDELVFNNNQRMGNSYAKRRVLHYNSAESAWKYQNKMGYGDMKQAMEHTITSACKNIGILDRLGPQADLVFNTVKQKLIDASDDPKIKTKMARVDKSYSATLGYDQQPISHLLANVGTALRSMVAMAELGGVVLTSLPDLANQLATMRWAGMGMFDRYGHILNNFRYIFPLSKDLKNFANSFGVMSHSFMGHYNNKWTALDSPSGMLSKVLGVYYKANLMDAWDRSIRLGFATALGRHLALLRDTKFENLPNDTQKSFLMHGIDNKFWDMIRSNREAMKTYKGKLFIAPDMIHQLTPESIEEYKGSKLTDDQMKMSREDIGWQLQTFFTNMTDHAQLAPRSKERAMLLHGLQPGTVPGEIARFLAQFKGYSVAISTRMVGRMLMENSDSNALQAILENKVSWQSLGDYMINAAIFGYLANAAHSIVKNGSIPNPTQPKNILDAWASGGGLGIYGDMLNHNFNSYGQGLVSLLGPVASKADQTLKLISQLVDYNSNNHRLSYTQYATKQLLNYGKYSTPFINMFYARLGTQLLGINHMVQQFFPDYLTEQNRQTKQDNQQYLQLF